MNDIGVIGMAVMGMNLALNIADREYKVAIYNRTTSKTLDIVKEHSILNGYETLEEFVSSLAKPRKIILMIQAGSAVDKIIEQLIPLLDKEDIIMDGGNSNFLDTSRRYQYLTEKGFGFLGVGISGGEEGARFGPAMMPGGINKVYDKVKHIFEDISAKVEGRPCVSFIGKEGAGHYVKMVHNGIEYGDMQIIAESYDLLKNLAGLTNAELATTYQTWNKGELDSYLIDITGQIFTKMDEDGYVVDYILDKAGQKGTGRWTVEASLSQGIDTSMIAQAVYARIMSSNYSERQIASKQLPKPEVSTILNKEEYIEDVRQALYVAKIISYAQGFSLMLSASKEYDWNLNLKEIALNFRGGCIIRAEFLNLISKAYEDNNDLVNLLLDDYFKSVLTKYLPALRRVVSKGIESGISLPSFTTAISYYDAYRTASGPANLIQAQRDYFGAHTFERKDKEGIFHYEWF